MTFVFSLPLFTAEGIAPCGCFAAAAMTGHVWSFSSPLNHSNIAPLLGTWQQEGLWHDKPFFKKMNSADELCLFWNEHAITGLDGFTPLERGWIIAPENEVTSPLAWAGANQQSEAFPPQFGWFAPYMATSPVLMHFVRMPQPPKCPPSANLLVYEEDSC